LKRDRSSQRKYQQACAAAVLEFNIDNGEGEKEAATRIARSVSKWHVFQTSKETSTTIINWRKAIKGGSQKQLKPFEGICEKLRSAPKWRHGAECRPIKRLAVKSSLAFPVHG
jgi:hypothetical protein